MAFWTAAAKLPLSKAAALPPQSIGVVAGVLIAFLIALPTYIPFARQIKGSGYLETRQTTSLAAIFPPNHWPSFVDADRLGNPAFKNWRGDPNLGVLNNYVEATVYFGVIPLLLALLGLYNRRARARWFWAAAALLILMCMFGFPYVSQLVARLPGFKYSALARTALLLPLPAAYLAAAGVQWCGARLRRAFGRGRARGAHHSTNDQRRDRPRHRRPPPPPGHPRPRAFRGSRGCAGERAPASRRRRMCGGSGSRAEPQAMARRVASGALRACLF